MTEANHDDQFDGDATQDADAPTGRRSLRAARERATMRGAAFGLRRSERERTTPRRSIRPVRTAAVLAIVGGLIAAVAVPAYAVWNPAADTQTLEQIAADNAQSLVIASDASEADLARDSYSATTPEEVAEKKAVEAALARAASSGSTASTTSSVDLSMVAPGSGEVRWPLDMSSITVGRGLWADGYHQGVDLLGAAGTPEFAAAAGVVRVAGWYYGYGYAVVIDHVIGGQSVSTLYGHMIEQPIVSVGQTVSAGQIIGLMGSTGSSTANHLHFEVHINGNVVDPYGWLVANAG